MAGNPRAAVEVWRPESYMATPTEAFRGDAGGAPWDVGWRPYACSTLIRQGGGEWVSRGVHGTREATTYDTKTGG